MTDTTRTEEVNIPLPVRAGSPLNEIVYTQYSYDDTKPKGQKVIITTRSFVVRDTPVDRFVQSRLNSLPMPAHVQTRVWNPEDPIEDRPINIYVGNLCWVVIELDRKIDWHFEPNKPGITTKSDYSDDNCDLVHVMQNGAMAGASGPSDDTCRLIYFVVQRRLIKMEHQGFRCHIIHGKTRLDDPDQVDPDIPNDGGRFPFPLIGPEDKGA